MSKILGIYFEKIQFLKYQNVTQAVVEPISHLELDYLQVTEVLNQMSVTQLHSKANVQLI